MTYLDPFPERYTPPASTEQLQLCLVCYTMKHFEGNMCQRCAWQNEGHEGITEDFSGDKTPQEREDDCQQR